MVGRHLSTSKRLIAFQSFCYSEEHGIAQTIMTKDIFLAELSYSKEYGTVKLTKDFLFYFIIAELLP